MAIFYLFLPGLKTRTYKKERSRERQHKFGNIQTSDKSSPGRSSLMQAARAREINCMTLFKFM
jgi:hypothetical protein